MVVQEKEHRKATRASQCTRFQASLRCALQRIKYPRTSHQCRYHPNCTNTYAYSRLTWPDCGHQGCIPTWGIWRWWCDQHEGATWVWKILPRRCGVLKLKKCMYGLSQVTMAFFATAAPLYEEYGVGAKHHRSLSMPPMRLRWIGPNSVMDWWQSDYLIQESSWEDQERVNSEIWLQRLWRTWRVCGVQDWKDNKFLEVHPACTNSKLQWQVWTAYKNLQDTCSGGVSPGGRCKSWITKSSNADEITLWDRKDHACNAVFKAKNAHSDACCHSSTPSLHNLSNVQCSTWSV